MKSMTELITFFQIEYPHLVLQMRNSSHHLTFKDQQILDKEYDGDYGFDSYPESLNPYHLEGNIWEHTLLVCKQAEKAPYRLKLAALLHDIGKPSTRSVNPKNGNVSFYNHDAVGAFMALEILKRPELELTKKEQVRIFSLIALHTQIYKLSMEQLAAIGDKELVADLIELGKFDHEGRFHSKGDAVIPHIDSIPFIRNGVTGYTKEVIVLVGLPASGKSTWKANIRGEWTHIGRDDILEANTIGNYYSEKWKNANQKEIDKLLQLNFNKVKEYGFSKVIVDMTHMSKKSRRKSLSHFGAEYKKKCVVFLTDLQTLSERNNNREGKVIPQEVIEKMMRSFYLPTYEEFDEIEFII